MLLGSLLLCLSPAALVAPTKLVVLQHGLYGAAVNMAVLQQELERLGGGEVLVHSASANEGRTRDGVAAGGRRLAAEVEQLVADVAHRGGSLRTISLVGNSLGGLYARHAAAELWDAESGLIAGLEPDAFVSVGCPHLGVRRFTFLPLPPPLQALGPLVAGRTADDLLLRDHLARDELMRGKGRPMLAEMAREGGRGVGSLRGFLRRRLYANLKGDFMVPFGTAALELGAGWGSGLGDARRMEAFAEGCRRGGGYVDPEVMSGRASGIGAMRYDVPPQAEGSVTAAAADASRWEEAIFAALDSCGWSKVGCAWRSAGTATPVAHNKLAALRRPEGWTRGFEAIEATDEGRPVMAHAAAYILGAERRL